MCACTVSSLDGFCTGAMFLRILSGSIYSCTYVYPVSSIMLNKWL